MPKTEVDLSELAIAVSNAILSFAQPKIITKQEIDELVESETPKLKKELDKKKSGRPKKNKPKPVEQDDNIQNTENHQFITSAKSQDFNRKRDDGGTYMKKVPFQAKKRNNNFVDNFSIAKSDSYNKDGKKIVYPDHADPRPKQEKQKYKCDLCGKEFLAFSSYIPSSVDGSSQPLIKCYNCNSR